MSFDPDKYLAQITKPTDFDPDAYLKTINPSADISALESGLRGAANSATFGFAPAISGAAQAVPTAMSGGSMQDILAAYAKARDASKAQFDAAQAANPISSGVGSLVGGLVPAALTGGVSAEATGLGAALSKATGGIFAPATAAGALTGAGYGALSGTGDAVSSGKGLGDTLVDAGASAAGGALIGGAMGKIANVLGGAPKALDEFGNERAVSATGMAKGQMRNLLKQDNKAASWAASQGTEIPESQVQKLGRMLSEPNGLTDTPIVTAGATPETILERANELKPLAGKEVGNILSQLDKSFDTNSENFPNPLNISAEITKQLQEPLLVGGEVPPAANHVANAISDVIASVNKFGNQPMTFEKAQQLKTLITSLANYDNEGSAANEVLRRAGGIINAAVEKSADAVAQESGTPELINAYKKAKDLYRAADQAVTASTGKVAGQNVNRDLGLTDYMAGAAGVASHGVGVGTLAAGGNKLARTYGNSIAAASAKDLSSAMSGMSKALVDAPKEHVVNFGKQLISSGGQLETSLGNVLVKAGERDDVGRNALIFSLMQNASYRELLRNYIGGKP